MFIYANMHKELCITKHTSVELLAVGRSLMYCE